MREALDARFFAPLKRRRTRRVGIEFEFPVWNLKPGKATDFAAVHEATSEFLSKFGFTDVSRDDEGDIYHARDPETEDELSFDCSYNTLELSFGPETDLNIVQRRFISYYAAIQEALNNRSHALTGMGINPRWRENKQEPIGNGRYRMLLHHLKSYSKYGGTPQFHDHPDFGLFSCASQAQIDADEENLVRIMNTFNLLEPFKTALLANSPFGEHGQTLCGRDALWSHSLHGLNPHNCGMYGVTLRSLDDVAGYLESTSIYCVERGDKYINFAPVPLRDYLARREIAGEYWDSPSQSHRKCMFTPSPDDVKWLRPFKFEDLTQRGTVEFRSVCEQPVREALASAALHAGLVERLSCLATLLAEDAALYGHGYGAAELRALMNRREWPSFVSRATLTAQLHRILALAESGLAERGFGEERLLAPLWRRADTLTSPAREHLERLERGETIDSIALDFGSLAGGDSHA